MLRVVEHVVSEVVPAGHLALPLGARGQAPHVDRAVPLSLRQGRIGVGGEVRGVDESVKMLTMNDFGLLKGPLS